jgi:hypothetical protein
LPFFISFFISGIGVIRGRSPLVLVAAEQARPRCEICGLIRLPRTSKIFAPGKETKR